MKKIFAIIASLAFAGAVYAGCPSKAFKAKLVSFDKESKVLSLKAGKKEIKVEVLDEILLDLCVFPGLRRIDSLDIPLYS